MSKISNRKFLKCSVAPLVLGVAIAATPAFAQTAQTDAVPPSATTTPAAGGSVDPGANEIIVTGSRIVGTTNATSANPISVSTAAQIELTKSSSVEDILARMVGPDSQGISSTSNNGGDGFSNVSLRNLGAQRTLVLLDGTRLLPTGATNNLVDLNMIPVSMIERIEVLRDGASSIYGADAIGGVVNIISKTNAHGFTVDSGFSAPEHGGGLEYHIGTTFAANTDRSNIQIGFNWTKRDAIAGSQRDWANDEKLGTDAEGGSAYRSQLDATQAEGPVTLGKATLVDGVLKPAGTVISGLVGVNGQFFTRTNPALAALLPNTAFVGGAVKLNANGSAQYPYNTLSGSSDRKQISASGHYDLTDDVTAYASGFFTKHTSEQLLRSEPLLGDTIASGPYPGFIVPANATGNPTTGSYAAYLTPLQFGPRDYQQDSQTFRIQAGFRGKIASKYNWEIGGVEQENTLNLAIGNSGNFNHLAQLQGLIPCVDVPGGCTNGLPNVGLNYYGDPAQIFSPAQLAYSEYTRKDVEHAHERYVYGNIGGSLFSLPAGEVKASIGGEYRGEHFDYEPDELTVEGFTANPSFPTSGGYNVGAVYGELSIPILADTPFFKSLIFTPSGRFDHYSTFGSAKTFKLGLNWQVNDDLRFRGNYLTGFRAPQVFELYGGQFVSDNGTSGDPCETNKALGKGNSNVGTGILTAGSTCSKAVANGAAVTTFTSPLDLLQSSQVPTLEGGSASLQPEKSREYNFGVVVTPTFIPGLTFEADYYRVKVKNTILAGGIGVNFGNDLILDQCYGPTQNQDYCNLIHRSATSGAIIQIDSLNANAGSQLNKGLDMELTYDTHNHMDLPIPGSVRLDLQVSHLIKYDQTDLLGNVVHYAGNFSVDVEETFPKWKAFANIDYTNGPLSLHYDLQYASPMSNYDGSDPTFGNHISSYWIHSISGAYTVRHMGLLDSAKFVVGIDNLFDKDPPFISSDSTCKCNSIAGPYDFAGRTFFARLTTSF